MSHCKSLVLLLAKDYLTRQLVLRRNVIHTGVLGCQLPLALPPFVIKYLGKTFNAWHIALELLQDSLKHLRDEEAVRDVALDALAELCAELREDNWFYGLWRRCALYIQRLMLPFLSSKTVCGKMPSSCTRVHSCGCVPATHPLMSRSIVCGKIIGFSPHRSCNNGTHLLNSLTGREP